jgi:hypothetical protein
MPYSIVLTAEKQDEAQLLEVKEVLDSIPGKYLSYSLKKGSKGAFIPSPPQEGPLSEAEFFSWMQAFREGVDLGDSQILVVLTSREIANRHFNGIDFEHQNIFVDIKNWRKVYLANASEKFPIAFHALISVLIPLYFDTKKEAQASLHDPDRGCILDYNRNKTNVDIKLLTARICPTCMDTFLGKLPDTNLLAYFRAGLEKIRYDIVEGEYYRKIQPKPIIVKLQNAPSKKSGCLIYFEGIGSIDLDVAHTVVYLYFLRNLKGEYLSDVDKDYFFLLQLYEELGGTPNPKLIAKLCRIKAEGEGFKPISEKNAMSERISKINREITVLLGTFGLEKYYQILKRYPSEKHGVDPQISFEDETGILKRLEPQLGKLKM